MHEMSCRNGFVQPFNMSVSQTSLNLIHKKFYMLCSTDLLIKWENLEIKQSPLLMAREASSCQNGVYIQM